MDAMRVVLLLSVFVIATCGLVYELIAGTLASYLLGDSVTQFSTVIGTYLFAMGVGSWLSRYFERNLVSLFVTVELLIAVIGGCSAAVLFILFDRVSSFRSLLYGDVFIIGTLVGLEIPILMRILGDDLDLRDLVSKVFTFDYIGALAASLAFPLVLVPRLGLVRSSFLFGILNAAVALATLQLLNDRMRWVRARQLTAAIVLAGLTFGFVYSDKLVHYAEDWHYPGAIVYAESTPYQRIVLTRSSDSLRLFLNGNLQFDTRDEYRYHEALVHAAWPGDHVKHALVLGGGDGMAVRELLKHKGIESVTLVDLDPAVTRLFTKRDELVQLNGGALLDRRVKVINADAFEHLKDVQKRFDYVVVDFPDPSNYSVGKLFTERFYKRLHRVVAPGGAAVIQSTSPFIARKAFWCVHRTMRAAGFSADAFHVNVPSFGEWGFVVGHHGDWQRPTRTVPGLRYLDPAMIAELYRFPADMGPVDTAVNRLDNQALVQLYEAEWGRYAANE